MNPIFSRRYKGGSRPNIMPTAAKRQSYMKSMGNAGASSGSSSSSLSSGSGSMFSTQSMGESVDDPSPGEIKSPEREDLPPFFTKLPRGKAGHGTASSPGSGSESASRLLAQQLLASKQNMLAQVSLTPHENRQRAKLNGSGGEEKDTKSGGAKEKILRGSLMRQSFSTENFNQCLSSSNTDGSGCYSSMTKSPTVHDIGYGDMTLCDLDDLDEIEEDHRAYGRPVAPSFYTSPVMVANSRISRPNLNQRISKESLGMKEWRELKQVVCGTGSFHEGWLGQGFVFDTKVPFGLVQKKGGPCGVLAVVQSLVLRNLLFGSPFSPKSQSETNKKLMQITAYLSAGGEECGAMEPESCDEVSVAESIRKYRVECLVDAVAEIIWNCGDQGQEGSKRDENQSSMIMFSDYRIQPEVICVQGRLELQHFLQNSIHRFDCIALVYSAVLTRGISGVKDDIDFENCCLIGLHGYCSQELINLLLIGRAISNTFDHEIELDGKVLKGIPKRCDIGLLSLFEHYDSIKVGTFFKCPRFPVWMICSESHFSVMFSTELRLCMDEDPETRNEDNFFDLFYYDGLARQEKVIRLSIRIPVGKNLSSRTSGGASCASSHFYNTPLSQDNQLSKSTYANRDEDLIPPLEKCIRTKWPGALVDWNDTEPIL